MKKGKKFLGILLERLCVFTLMELKKKQNIQSVQSIGEVVIQEKKFQIQMVLEPRESHWINNGTPITRDL